MRALSAFAWRRIHSLMGLWLVLYLIVHLITNSQAVLWLGQNGAGFIRLVNILESLPYLQVIELLLIGVPLGLHGIWGIKRALEAKENKLPYTRNRAFTWQRLTSWILLFGIIFHVVQMRFIQMPKHTESGYVVTIKPDPSIEQLAKEIGVTVEPDGDKLIATAESPGKAMLLMVRETFKSFWMSFFYSIFVVAAAFHSFNGFWTALITWGVLLSMRSQRAFLALCWAGVFLLSFLGLAAIWGSYFLARTPT